VDLRRRQRDSHACRTGCFGHCRDTAFLHEYVANREDSIDHIRRVLHEGLLSATGKNLFAGRFGYLNTCGLSPEQIFIETLATLFNAPAGGALHVENLKGVTGEVALRVGDNDPFGVINVGDDAKLVKLCEGKGPYGV